MTGTAASPSAEGSNGAAVAPAAGAADRPREGASGSRISLATRLFLIIACLIVLAVGASIAITALVAQKIAGEVAAEELTRSDRARTALEEQRYFQLALISNLFVQDADLAAYVAEAAVQSDTASILDILGQRQRDLGFDFAIVLTPEGEVLAHTGRPGMVGRDLSDRSLVAAALDDYEAAGVWEEEGVLYDAVVVPVVRGFDLSGFLVAGFRVDDTLAEELEEISRADVLYLLDGPDDRLVPSAGTLDSAATAALVDTLEARWGEIGGRMESGGRMERLEIDLAGEPWLALVSPIRDAAGETVGATVALSSLAEQLAPFRRLQWLLAAAGGLAILLALALSYPLARRALGPLRDLSQAAEAARRGDYDQPIPQGGGRDEVGRLAGAFSTLLQDLREKRDMESYMSQLSRTLPEAGLREERRGGQETGGLTRMAGRVELVLLGAELRHLSRAGGGQEVDAQATMERLARDLRRLDASAMAHRGQVESFAGHRALVRFEGGGAVRRALAVAGELLDVLGDGSAGLAPALAVAAGTAVQGMVSVEGRARPALVGLTLQEVDRLLREAAPGDVMLSPSALAIADGALDQLGIELSEQRSLVSTQTVYSLRESDLRHLTETMRIARGRRSAGDGSAEDVTVHLPTGARPGAGDTGGDPRSVTPPSARMTLSELGPGAVLGGRFELLSLLGAGGMGQVFKARDRDLDDIVALKILKKDVWGDAETLARLKDELKLARRITHPNVLRTFDFGELDGVPFVSMEYVRGVTLRSLLDSTERLPFSAALRLARQIAAGLGAAHRMGVIHRDLKPENLILDAAGNARLMDFGIARLEHRSDPGLTKAGFVVGTPQYLSPEQLGKGEVTVRSDIYSAGILLYEVFVGQPPFPVSTIAKAIAHHLNDEPPAPRTVDPSVPPAVEDLLLTCLAKDPSHRFADANALLVAIERVEH